MSDRTKGATWLVVVAEAIQQLDRTESNSVYGVVREAEGIVQILPLDASNDAGLRRIGQVVAGVNDDRSIAVEIGSTSVAIRIEPDVPMPVHVEVQRLTDAESRRQGLVPAGGLGAKKVVLFGAGSVGSALAVLLAQAGVSFRIVDRDTLDASNLSRHAGTIRDIGRSKALVVADLCRQRGVVAEALGHDILEASSDELADMLRDADLVLATTDSAAAQFVVNEACITAGIPLLHLGAYERALAGEILLVTPGLGPCLYCAVGFRAEIAPDLGPAERRMAYRSADAGAFVAEPGLAVDIANLVAIGAAYALAVLHPAGSRKDLLDPSRCFVLAHGGSTPRDGNAELFAGEWSLAFARVQRDDPCPVCGYVTIESERS